MHRNSLFTFATLTIAILMCGHANAMKVNNNLAPQIRMNVGHARKFRQTVDHSFGAKLRPELINSKETRKENEETPSDNGGQNEQTASMALHTNYQLSGNGEYLAAQRNAPARSISVAMPTTMYGNKPGAGSLRQGSSVQYKETDLNFATRKQALQTTSVWDEVGVVHLRKRPGRHKFGTCQTPAAPSPLPMPFPNIAKSTGKKSASKGQKHSPRNRTNAASRTRNLRDRFGDPRGHGKAQPKRRTRK